MRHVLIAIAVMSLAGCGAGVDSPGSAGRSTGTVSADPNGGSADSTGQAPPASGYYRVRPDPRECPSPACGGWWVARIGGTTPETYVAGLNFDPAGLKPDTVAEVLAAPADAIVLFGAIAQAATSGPPTFAASRVWLGLPGVSATQDTLYTVTASPLACAGCAPLLAERVGSAEVIPADALSVTGALRPRVQEDYVVARVLRHGGLVAASIASNATSTTGTTVVVASQVFVQLPDDPGPCPAPVPSTSSAACEPGLVPVFTRDADRCVVQSGCVKPEPCPLSPILACDPGYRAASWVAAPDACETYACDPGFSTPSP